MSLFEGARIDLSTQPKIDDRFSFTQPKQKLDILGSHFALINNENRMSNKVGLNNIINVAMEKFKSEQLVNNDLPVLTTFFLGKT